MTALAFLLTASVCLAIGVIAGAWWASRDPADEYDPWGQQ
jgi:hypothetical protein